MIDKRITPPHYKKLKHEPIDVISDWGLNFNLGNVVKYISRAGLKGDKLADLNKALDYLKHEIEQTKNNPSQK